MIKKAANTNKLAISLLASMLLLVSCTQASPALPAGQVNGRLVANGKPLSGVTVYIAIAPQEGTGSTWVKMNNTTADESGNFIYENMAPGNYLLMVGGKEALGSSFKYVIKDGERYTFELPEEKGIDLGEVDATVTRGNP
ncbi:MAG: hypothetical protein JXA13_08045 [Anaerolineales bacterium]|nr:hypothetical protein [Anaerolineales bacterium]